MIRVVNKYTHTPTQNDVFVGRPSPLGNPYSHMENTKAEHKVITREEAIAKYREWFEHARLNDVAVHNMLNKMCKAHRAGIDMNLVCYCAPKPCHGDVIKEYIEKTTG